MKTKAFYQTHSFILSGISKEWEFWRIQLDLTKFQHSSKVATSHQIWIF